MPKIKKTSFNSEINKYESDNPNVDKYEAIEALLILALLKKPYDSRRDPLALNRAIAAFQKSYYHSHLDTLDKIRKRCSNIDSDVLSLSPEKIYDNYKSSFLPQFDFDKEPSKLFVNGKDRWIFKGYEYEVQGHYSDEQARLLILEDFDKERRYFEKLKAKFDETTTAESVYERPRIPENVRIEVWRRDGGKCARCGSREKLEYDHIVPVSKGGSNTARNIELLCEKHNRSKSNNIV